MADYIDSILRQAAVELSDCGSYQEAARRLGVTVSEVRLRIDKLETLMCISLFNFSTDSPVVTEEGQVLIQRFRESLARVGRTEDQ